MNQFCSCFGREAKPGCLRKPTTRAKVFQKFQTNFTPLTLKNHRKFSLLVKLIACMSIFRQAALPMECMKRETGIGDYSGSSDKIAANIARVVYSQILQLLAVCMSHGRAFSLALSGATHQGMSYFDVRLRFGRGNVMHNFRLLAIPLFERHTRAYMLEVLVCLIDAMTSRWGNSVIAVCSDAAPNKTGKSPDFKRFETLEFFGFGTTFTCLISCVYSIYMSKRS
ncbi:hypothetical protein PHMEG_0005341 [Phytophthora megakarya]|uniref:Uncharacterized protein n=1 Tax=Phytophthora megakarya TaxID=4795 RepID=A0A225WT85_9STRA|nr:hypothetical protein PHMEG_0005341 [Phytophthora megakarya]